jgi:prophage regulatory protein
LWDDYFAINDPWNNPMTRIADKKASALDAATLAATFTAEKEERAPAPIRILRLPEVINRVGLKRASIYDAIARGSFPKQIVLSNRAVGWVEQEIEAWLAARIRETRIP